MGKEYILTITDINNAESRRVKINESQKNLLEWLRDDTFFLIDWCTYDVTPIEEDELVDLTK